MTVYSHIAGTRSSENLWVSSSLAEQYPLPGSVTGLHKAAVKVPIASLRPADSPRLAGVNREHVELLAASGSDMPPVLVHRPTMQMIDGTHRLLAAIMRGEDTIAVRYFDGNTGDAFLLGVRVNVIHGLPLTRADREAAVVRILTSHAELSDRAIASVTGLSAPTVSRIRHRTVHEPNQLLYRVGRDGRWRPLNSAASRRRAGERLAEQPDASLREIAAASGLSVGTARDVRDRIRRGEDPVPPAAAGFPSRTSREILPAKPVRQPDYRAELQRLSVDPVLRFNQLSRTLLGWLEILAVDPIEQEELLRALPTHCVPVLAKLARGSAAIWSELGERIAQRS